MQAAVVSMDLPFAQARWCAAQGDVKLEMLSDYRDHSFGMNYGLLIAELGLLGARHRRHRQGRNGLVRPDRAGSRDEPDYDAALKGGRRRAA